MSQITRKCILHYDFSVRHDKSAYPLVIVLYNIVKHKGYAAGTLQYSIIIFKYTSACVSANKPWLSSYNLYIYRCIVCVERVSIMSSIWFRDHINDQALISISRSAVTEWFRVGKNKFIAIKVYLMTATCGMTTAAMNIILLWLIFYYA